MATKRVNADLEVAGEVISGGENLNQKIDYLEYLLPEAPLPLDSMELEAGQVSGGIQTAGLADDAASTYAYGMAAGDQGVPNVINDSTPQIVTINSTRVVMASLLRQVSVARVLKSFPDGLFSKKAYSTFRRRLNILDRRSWVICMLNQPKSALVLKVRIAFRRIEPKIHTAITNRRRPGVKWLNTRASTSESQIPEVG